MNDELVFNSNGDESVTIKYSELRKKYITYSFLMSILELSDEEFDSINLEVKKLRDEYKIANGIG